MKLWIAQGLGIGRIPFAPGTFGSLLGMVWFWLLLAGGNLWLFVGGTLAGIALSVYFCDQGEKLLGQKDPGSVVLDEVAAVPICFTTWVLLLLNKGGAMPGISHFFSGPAWPVTVGVFVACRVFDIAKPWPVRQSQALPGGWGITVDDVLAAVYVNLTTLVVFACWPRLLTQ